MSTSEQNRPSLCWSCKENEATVPYMVGPRATLVCPRCREWLTARDELDQLLRDNMDLEEAGRVDEVLHRLATFVEAHAHQDQDLQFRGRIAHHRAMTLFDAQRFAEAETACADWARLGFANVWERWEHGFETARTLRALERPREALAALEDALSEEDGRFLDIAEKLELIVDLSDELGQPVDPKWGPFVQRVAAAYGIELESQPLLGKRVRQLAEAVRDKLPIQR